MRGLVIFLIVIAAIAALFFLGWSRVPDMLANNLSKKLGVAVTIDTMGIRPKQITVNKLVIGNAKGYSLPKAFSAQRIKLRAPMTHYLKDHVIVEEIDVSDIYLGLEFDSSSGTSGNWTKIMRHYIESADLDEKDNQKVTINKIVFTNIRTEILFHDGGSVKKLPTIKRIELKGITTEGGFPTDQLMSSILGQMLKEVFIQQNLNNMLKGLLLDSPGKAIDSFLKPFKDIFNAVPKDEIEQRHSA